MAPIGNITAEVGGKEAHQTAQEHAANLPDLLVDAKRIAHTVAVGWHGRRQKGIGDTFWQFRAYDINDPITRIDWRRTARDNVVTVREQEWEAAHTVWLWADNSTSMRFKSNAVSHSKQERALVITFVLAEVLARAGERIGWAGLTQPILSRNAASKITEKLAQQDYQDEQPLLPPVDNIKNGDAIVVSDMMIDTQKIKKFVEEAVARNVRPLLIEVIDPAEEMFPYAGHTEFQDPETKQTITFGSAQMVADEYRQMFAARREEILSITQKYNATMLSHRTDQNIANVLVSAFNTLGDGK